MSLYTLVLFFFTVVFLTGCTATAKKIEDIQQRAIKSMRDPGENMARSPESTAEIYSCKPYTRNKLILEHVEVIPKRVSAGDEVNQRVRYAFCPYVPAGTANGEIIRTVYFKGTSLFQDVSNYEFKPGTWTVDAFVIIPPDAQNGIYAIEVVLRHGSEVIRRSNTFTVSSR